MRSDASASHAIRIPCISDSTPGRPCRPRIERDGTLSLSLTTTPAMSGNPEFAEIIEFLSPLSWTLYGATCGLLLLYGLNNYVLVGILLRSASPRAREQREAAAAERVRRFRARHDSRDDLPRVLTQLPIFNEMNVAERVIRAAAAIDYPKDRHRIQVLDDSTDETAGIVDAAAAELQSAGHRVDVVRRPTREGFKAGALKHGLEQSDARYIAIFDSDFVPRADFFTRTLPHLVEQPDVGLVQTRWGHINGDQNGLTRAIALGIDGHFAVEQTARSRGGLFLNFNGTGGVWKREAIEDAGGWQADTLTEDMDLSYRAQLAGWRIDYLPDITTPAEIPASFTAYRAQQFRWAKGSIQTALKILPRLIRAPVSAFKKVQGAFHLTQYFIHFALAVLAILTLPIAFVPAARPPMWFWWIVGVPVIVATLGPTIMFLTAQYTLRGRDWWRSLAVLPNLLVVGFGSSISNTHAVLEAFAKRPSGFLRTPKQGDRASKKYALPKTFVPWIEIGASLYCLTSLLTAVSQDQFGMAFFLIIFTLGYAVMGTFSLAEYARM